MGVDISHIIRNDYYEVNDLDKSKVYAQEIIEKLKKGKTYFIKVRAYNKNADNSLVYGKWSKVKKVKIVK